MGTYLEPDPSPSVTGRFSLQKGTPSRKRKEAEPANEETSSDDDEAFQDRLSIAKMEGKQTKNQVKPKTKTLPPKKQEERSSSSKRFTTEAEEGHDYCSTTKILMFSRSTSKG